jgi:hypothetical protein
MTKQPQFSLEEIESAVRPQFSWDRSDPRTRWRNANREMTNWNEWMGASVFVGLACLFGHPIREVKVHMDLEPAEVEQRLQFFKHNMQRFTSRLLKDKEETPRKKADTDAILYRKTSLTMNALRLTAQYKTKKR